MSKFKAGIYELDLTKKTYIMGILNVTPDSFSDGGMYNKVDLALKHCEEMVNNGADIIDIGAQSTRPGCIKISINEELKRLIPVLDLLQKEMKIPISIDTFYPKVAEMALNYGASIINDVTGFSDVNMMDIAKKSNCGCIVMCNKPNNFVKNFFEKKLGNFKKCEIKLNRICLDPGIGFGKTYKEDLDIIRNLNKYIVKNCAILVGASRKRVIGRSCLESMCDQRISGTIAAHTIAIMNGANIIRVHDVKEAVQAAKVVDAILKNHL